MKIATIVGARPQFVKAAAVSRSLAAKKGVREVLIHTGQHFDASMSDIFFQEMEIPAPHHHLGIGGGSHGAMTGRMLEAVEAVLLAEKPDWMVVYGDTNSTIAGSLAAAKLHIPVAHVEAGLRSFNRRMPEEVNRILTDHCADLLLTPTSGAAKQLEKEGIPASKIVEVGDVMYDAALFYSEKARVKSTIHEELNLKSGYILATIHRAENTDDAQRLEQITGALSALAASGNTIVLPLHPRTKKALESLGLIDKIHPHVRILPPVGYFDMIRLEQDAKLIVTDSGGVQKEAYFFRVPCVTVRDQTEWVELIDHGFNRLAAPTIETIASACESALASKPDWEIRLYGSGDASVKIVNALS